MGSDFIPDLQGVHQHSLEWPGGAYDGKRGRPDRVKKPFDLIPNDLVTDFRFASRILWKLSKMYAAFS